MMEDAVIIEEIKQLLERMTYRVWTRSTGSLTV